MKEEEEAPRLVETLDFRGAFSLAALRAERTLTGGSLFSLGRHCPVETDSADAEEVQFSTGNGTPGTGVVDSWTGSASVGRTGRLRPRTEDEATEEGREGDLIDLAGGTNEEASDKGVQ